MAQPKAALAAMTLAYGSLNHLVLSEWQSYNQNLKLANYQSLAELACYKQIKHLKIL
jgi:hypothetical protein